MTVDIETDSITANKIFHDNPDLNEPCSFSGFHKKSKAKNSDMSYIVIPEENTENEKKLQTRRTTCSEQSVSIDF